MPYLLDTNIVFDVVRRPAGRVARLIAAAGEGNVSTSIVVAAEIRFGVAKLGSSRLRAQMEIVLGALEIHAFSAPADRVYGEVRASLERRGLPISANDMLIAAHALALDRILVTDNVREFSRIDGLAVENWLR